MTNDDTTTDDSGHSFLTSPDGGGNTLECDLWDQDCEDGFKCASWAVDGGNSWTGSRCVPIDPMPDPIGAPCTVEEFPLSGLDSCGFAAMCWNVSPELTGTCIPMCTGNESNPQCPEGTSCILTGDPDVLPCLNNCNPLDASSCLADEGCYPANELVCLPDASARGGAAGEACEFINACDQGLMCANVEPNGFCEDDAFGCCLPFCDLAAPECPEAFSCIPFFSEGSVDPLADELGVCLLD